MLNEQDEARRDGKATSGSTFPRKTSFKREIDAPDYDALKDLKACRKEYEENEKSHDAKLYELLQRGARDARKIRTDDELWEKFENDPFWIKSYNGGKPRPQKLKRDKKSALRYALIYMLRARTEEAKQLARKYTRSVAKHLDRGVKISDLAETMSQAGNGIEESSRASSPKAKADPKKTTRKRPSNDDGKGVDDQDGFADQRRRTWTLSGKKIFRKKLRSLKPGGTIQVVLKRLGKDEDHDFDVAEIAADELD
jgi:hypothetical protein